jgi:hypothetical protein
VLPGNPAIILARYAPLRAERPPSKVDPTRVTGVVDAVSRVGRAMQLTGWVVGPDNRPAQRVVAFAGDRLVAAGVPNRTREDVAKDRGIQAGDVGYVLALPADLRPSEREGIRLYGIAGGAASPLKVLCGPLVRTLGC